jgi:hypothetical protein
MYTVTRRLRGSCNKRRNRREICWRQADEEREKKKEQKRLFELKQQEEDARWAAEQAADILAVEAAKWACRWPRDLNHISVADKE